MIFVFLVMQDVCYFGYKVICRWTKWIVSYGTLIFRKRNLRKYKYDMKNISKPYEAGFFIPPVEWDIESPSESQGTDEMFCFGVNSSGECLALQIARECACDSSSSLFLKINGHTYILPNKYNYLITNDRKIFGSNRYYMQCLAPFRKWKIFFNGMLRKVCPSEGLDQLIHVRISLIWVASSGIFDFISDYSSHNMADILSIIKWSSFTPPIKKVLSILNEYHQPGMLHGTFQLETDPERELKLWGCRRHAFGTRIDDVERYIDLFGNSEVGHLFYFKLFKMDALDWTTSGYIMLPNGYLEAIQVLSTRRISNSIKNTLSFKVKAGNLYYNIYAMFYEYGQFLRKQTDKSLTVSVVDTVVNGVWGGGVAVERVCTKPKLHEKCEQILSFLKLKKVSGDSISDPFVVNLDDTHSLSKGLSGNFGSTLAKMWQMKDHVSGYQMENALIITTSGYEEYISSAQQLIQVLKENACKCDADELLPLCERIVEKVSNSNFPLSLHNGLIDNFNKLLIDMEKSNFCIYPSFCGEGAEVQLLEAYLLMYKNVHGLSEIIKCVKKCWASQFSFVAIQCKRSTGQLLNVPMAIVIQKNIAFQISGVISTCESSTGNPSIMQIREVSSGIIRIAQLKRDVKDFVIIENLNVVNVEIDSSEESKANADSAFDKKNCLLEEQILLLGKVACKIEKFFQFPLCIEWCLKKKTFCIIQVRPITLMTANTKSEILHNWDSYLRTEDEWFSVYSTGEGFVGAMSPLGMNLLNFCIEVFVSKLNDRGIDLWAAPEVPYCPKFLVYSHYHAMYCLADGLLRLQHVSPFFEILSKILNFKVEGDEILHELISHRIGSCHSYFRIIWQSIWVLFSSGFKSKDIKKVFSEYDFNSEAQSSNNLLHAISNHYQDITEAFVNFMYYTYKAVLWNMLVFHVLQKIKRSGNNSIYSDFNILMSACSKLEVGDIAVDILALTNKIATNIDPLTFKTMPLEDAIVWLEDTEIDKKVKFSEFLDKHGHRCHKEVDIFQKCWSMDPIIVVRVLQAVMPLSPYTLPPQFSSIDHVFNQLSAKPNFFQRLLLKYTIPRCAKAIREAKKAKSFLLKIASYWRKAFYELADCAVKEFQIPFQEALFFLSLSEIQELLSSGSPDLVKRALNYWEIHADVDKFTFPVITIGNACPLNGKYYTDKRLEVGSCLKGLPMSSGTVTGIAVVITNFNEAAFVEEGSVLITQCPSIVWSLYFPVLGGFAADLGGLLSEGGTAARDYGLPCVIGLVRASKILKTGDRVFLDANVGILRRIES